ncbi:alkaline phosphatase PhoX [Nonomuraea ferruginea]
MVASSGSKVAGLTWHAAPDGGACFPDGDGWIYVSNSELSLLGGAAAIRFRPDGSVGDAYRILSGTELNRAGGATPWNTWLSCELGHRGRVFECDPYGARAPRPRLAMGRFKHEAAACDPDRRVVYLTEGEPDGCFYRFRPYDWGDLTEGALEVLCGSGRWEPVPWLSRAAQGHPPPGARGAPVRPRGRLPLRGRRVLLHHQGRRRAVGLRRPDLGGGAAVRRRARRHRGPVRRPVRDQADHADRRDHSRPRDRPVPHPRRSRGRRADRAGVRAGR